MKVKPLRDICYMHTTIMLSSMYSISSSVSCQVSLVIIQPYRTILEFLPSTMSYLNVVTLCFPVNNSKSYLAAFTPLCPWSYLLTMRDRSRLSAQFQYPHLQLRCMRNLLYRTLSFLGFLLNNLQHCLPLSISLFSRHSVTFAET